MASSQCRDNPPTRASGAGEGQVVDDLGGLKAYVAGSPGAGIAVLLVSDIYAAGFFAVVPDFLYGDPYVPDNAERPLPVWIQSHKTDKAYEDAKSVISALRSKGITAMGAAGYCWGAKVVVELAKTPDIQAGVMLHPSFVTVDDIKDVKCPMAVLGAERDHVSPPELVKQFEEILAAKSEVDSFVKIFPRVAHGWSVRYKEDDEFAAKSAEEALENMLGWFVKCLKCSKF
ncbi:uncharacterized protein A4U43_C04F34560 [Asparagus officinalis]|uniref:Dienelactone hydrolase domain-containing protein n=1 Tax=Asparagus officinalis TaxID=4686 RepID=A0A5P1FB20_ASPOF|nr:uncharacterized protein A4U43_C04F34560 [Asparagus officinalis]